MTVPKFILTSLWALGMVAGAHDAFVPVGPSPGYATALRWEWSADPTVAGYRVRWGSVSGQYDHIADAGKARKIIVGGFVEGRTYYWTVCAYDGTGKEGAQSPETSFRFTENSQVWVVLEHSTDMANWSAVRTYSCDDAGKDFFRLKIVKIKPPDIEQNLVNFKAAPITPIPSIEAMIRIVVETAYPPKP